MHGIFITPMASTSTKAAEILEESTAKDRISSQDSKEPISLAYDLRGERVAPVAVWAL